MTETKPKIPAVALPKLRDAWLRAYGAAQAAEAARQVSNAMFTQYQQALAAHLDAMGLNSEQKWWLDFDTGELSDTPPPEQQTNGTVQ